MDPTAEIREPHAVAAALVRATSQTALRSVRCEILDGSLILRGEVPSYYLKQLAQEAIRSLLNIGQIINHVEVRRTN